MAAKAPIPSGPSAATGSVIRIKPNHYIHVTDSNTAITSVVVGPQTFTKQEHEVISAGPLPSIMIPPRHYCVVQNPVVRNEKGDVVRDKNGLIKLRHGNEEIRFAQEPFPLFPGEKLGPSGITALQVVNADCALMLRCLRPFVDASDPKAPLTRNAGDEWIFKGPATYIPRVEVQVVEVIKSMVVVENTALKLRARRAFVDRKKHPREAGEEWLWRETGAFLPDVDEEVLGVVKATVLTDKKALHLRATCTFTDIFGVKRNAGDEWLVTIQRASTHIPDVYEQVVGEVDVMTLTSRQYCVILDPFDGAKQHYGQKLLRRGECSFFLNPGETLEKGIQSVIVLGEEEALLLTATEDLVEGGVNRKAGHRWMVYGPRDYIPPIQVQVIEKRKTIPLDQNEGVYVRNIKSGKITSIIGESYMLKPDEELWSKPLSSHVEALLEKQGRDDHHDFRSRDKTRVVSYRAPHNSAVQVYDYQRNIARVVFGPELVILAPDEEFTILNLSGGVPKKTGQIKSISLLLGPDFMTDVTIVETSDHARLSLKLSYNWYFDVNPSDKAACAALFAVPDFVGDACKAIASLVRSAVASTTFDDFHKHSASIIRRSAFGIDAQGKVNDKLRFNANRLVITNIDIQSVEPVDQRTRDALQKSVQLAIEITTKSQEASARHEAERLEQEAKGKLERQRIEDEAEAEKARKELVALQAASNAVEATGEAVAVARAKAEAQEIEGEASVKQSELAASAAKIQGESEIASLRNKHLAEIENARDRMALEITKARELSEIETEKFTRIIQSIGAETLQAMAEAGPATQAKLLEGLGLSSCMITDGNSPINLFQTAQGLLEQQQ